VRVENMVQKIQHQFHIENNEVVLESELNSWKSREDYHHDPISEGVRESEVIKQAIALAQVDNCDPEYMMQVLVNLMICIKNGNCELPIKNFK
jgi:hypothetical protein